VFNDANGDGRRGRNERPLAGQTVDLIDATNGDIVATTTSDARGTYSFDVTDGLGLGRYQVRVELPDGLVQTTPVSVIALSRGDVFVAHVDIGIGGLRSGAGPQSLTTASAATTGGQVDGSSLTDSSKHLTGCTDEERTNSDLTQSFV